MHVNLSKSILLLTFPLLFYGCTQSYDLAPVVSTDQRFDGYYQDTARQNRTLDDGNRSLTAVEQNAAGSNRKVIGNDKRSDKEDKKNGQGKLVLHSSDNAGLIKNISSPLAENPVDSRKNKSTYTSNKTEKSKKKPLSKRLKSDNNQDKNKKKSIISIDNKNMLMLDFQWPIKGKIRKNFSQTSNKGIDINGVIGQAVRATEAGKVVYIGQGLIGFGNLLIIKHNKDYLSAYANTSSLFVKEGQQVKKGQDIAKIGMAVSKKAFLHFEIRKNGKSVNPLSLLPKND